MRVRKRQNQGETKIERITKIEPERERATNKDRIRGRERKRVKD